MVLRPVINCKLAARRAVDDLVEDPFLIERLQSFKQDSSSSRQPSTVKDLALSELALLQEQLKKEILASKKGGSNGRLLSMLSKEDDLNNLLGVRSEKKKSIKRKEKVEVEVEIIKSPSSTSRSSSSEMSSSSSYQSAQTDSRDLPVPELPSFLIPRLDTSQLEDPKKKGSTVIHDGQKSFRNEVIQVVAIPSSSVPSIPPPNVGGVKEVGVSSSDSSHSSRSVHSQSVQSNEDLTTSELEKLAKDMTFDLMNDNSFVDRFKRGEVDVNEAIVSRIRRLLEKEQEGSTNPPLHLIPSSPLSSTKDSRDIGVQIAEPIDNGTQYRDACTSPQSSSSLSDYSQPFLEGELGKEGDDESSSDAIVEGLKKKNKYDLLAKLVLRDYLEKKTRNEAQIDSAKSGSTQDTISALQSLKPENDRSQHLENKKKHSERKDVSSPSPVPSLSFPLSPRVTDVHKERNWRPATRILRVEETDLSSSANDTVSASPRSSVHPVNRSDRTPSMSLSMALQNVDDSTSSGSLSESRKD